MRLPPNATGACRRLLAAALLAGAVHAASGTALAVSGGGGGGQAKAPFAPPESAAHTIRAVRVTSEIKVDGRLDEPAWAEAPAAGDFHQQEPNSGAPATEKTEVRVLYDDKYLYVGIHAFDSEPSKIQARELVRDSAFSSDDKVEILLDTNHDRRNAYRFAVNPLGTQQDALITDEGRDINVSWDAPWLSEGRIDETGYTVEVAIPLTTLRYDEGASVWGFNVARQIRRKHEETLWTAYAREFGLERVSQAGELTGVEGIHRRRLLEIKPYVSGGWRQGVPLVGREGFDAGVRLTGGIDVAKVGITPSLTAEFTVNPDFGNAEVDQQIVSLSRFSIFLPEKRDFFLENAGIFLFGRAESNQLFFTRRIGLTQDGEPVPIDYGAKVTGKVGPYNVGFFQVQTRELGDPGTPLAVPREQFTIARVKRDILGRSSIGAMVVNRQGGPGGDDYNRGAGVDMELNLTDHYLVKGFLMGTATPGVRSSFLSGRVDSRYEDDRFRLIAVYEDVGTNFNPEVGFAERTGFRQYFGQAAYTPQPRWIPGVRSMEFETQLEYYADRAGKLSTRQPELSWDTVFHDSSDLFFRPIEDHTEVLTEPFEIRPGVVIPTGAYRFNRPILGYTSDASRRVSGSLVEQWGDFFGGRLGETVATLTFRPNEHFLVDLSDGYNDVALPAGSFTTNLLAGRVNYNASRRLLTSAFVQVNSDARLTAVNVRLRYIYRPNSDLYVIYNQTTGRGLEAASYSLQVKLTYDFTF